MRITPVGGRQAEENSRSNGPFGDFAGVEAEGESDGFAESEQGAGGNESLVGPLDGPARFLRGHGEYVSGAQVETQRADSPGRRIQYGASGQAGCLVLGGPVEQNLVQVPVLDAGLCESRARWSHPAGSL
ncbi:hypothetical protein OHA17_16065 [Streptomyces sp. NBC_00212]